MNLKEANDKFIHNLKEKGRAEATITAYSKDIEQIIEYLVKEGIEGIKDIKSKQLNDFMQKMASEGYTPKSISRKTNSTKTFFKYLYEDLGVIKNNPADMVSHPKLDPKAPRILSKIEYKALRDAVKDDTRTLAIVEILLQTGVRISELSEIKLSEIKLGDTPEKDQGVLQVPQRGNTPEREIPLNSSVQKAIQEYIKIRPNSKKDYLFVTKTGNQLLVRNIRATLDKYFKEIGLDNVKVNDLRHTFIAQHLQRGAPLYIVSKIAGHKRLSTTEKYLEYITISEKSSKYELDEL
ncbi:hypothetical protein COV24_01140 [candidate division WWE3 bacterium CG10_big_fil_rev_8_21_14_0_10_32_10]|uniref:Tyrosine recombinase XerC n=1 Tax=candidate division WWE3 bacterium CG10_big_fil_rev_8_21_14_0_10_32_10 TaxID=1975090 RepID=A0A2H0RB81_UNCKA|nr:MAG: hypothetical protein COV24_01140 [candidate division WWE3 bacterium CG10_big_fil_rev_8_21_14_0_10_32_10]